MATKKNKSSKPANDDSILNKIASQAGHVAGELIVAKNQVVEKAGNAIEKVKTTVRNLTGSKKPAAKKAAKAVKKVAKKAAKKAAPVKKAAKKAVKKIAKKAAPVKKAAKKMVKKVAPAKISIRRR
jgi:hypothetical protein